MFELVRGKRQQAVDPIDDKADRGIAPHDDHTRLLIGFNARQLQQRSQADDRQDDPEQVGEPEQARRHQRQKGHIRPPDVLGDRGKPQRERFSRKLENQQILGGGIFPSRNKWVSGRRNIGRFAGLLTSTGHRDAEWFPRARRFPRSPPRDPRRPSPAAWPPPQPAPMRRRLPRRPKRPAWRSQRRPSSRSEWLAR